MKANDFYFKKKYGQNFLKDDCIPNKIVRYSDIPDDTLVIEIGPGRGILTKALAMKAKQVLSYEIDTTLKDSLDLLQLQYPNVNVIYDDFLNRNVLDDIKDYTFQHLYVIANLPYYITTPIILKFITEQINVDRLIVMVQKEVGERFQAVPGNKQYSSITVFLNYYFHIKKLFDVNRGCFVPQPNVDSVIMLFERKETRLVLKDPEIFFQLVRDSFQFKRKTIRNNLRCYSLDIVEKVLKKHGFDLTSRAEEIPLEVFVDISNNLS
ncbi:MAG: 16S rRNA (adenine(1518)-N(6)/adenine(1519)-N(6))-dimethyltransferase RsmA [bacterium]|nr:16S rRNA (adenine(1518)-N(6)/adenine(1519)-N(6))-dimethyltransferase RsmA [bacterium]